MKTTKLTETQAKVLTRVQQHFAAESKKTMGAANGYFGYGGELRSLRVLARLGLVEQRDDSNWYLADSCSRHGLPRSGDGCPKCNAAEADAMWNARNVVKLPKGATAEELAAFMDGLMAATPCETCGAIGHHVGRTHDVGADFTAAMVERCARLGHTHGQDHPYPAVEIPASASRCYANNFTGLRVVVQDHDEEWVRGTVVNVMWRGDGFVVQPDARQDSPVRATFARIRFAGQRAFGDGGDFGYVPCGTAHSGAVFCTEPRGHGWVDELLADAPPVPPNPHYACGMISSPACPTGEHGSDTWRRWLTADQQAAAEARAAYIASQDQ
jgi:hypothetical protein